MPTLGCDFLRYGGGGVTGVMMHDASLRESLKFLQDRRSGESRYFTRPYTILPDRQILCYLNYFYAKLWYMYIKLYPTAPSKFFTLFLV